MNRETFSYQFKNLEVIESNDPNVLLLLVSGKYRLGIGEQISETSIISFNRLTNTVDIIGNNINVEGMSVYFKYGC